MVSLEHKNLCGRAHWVVDECLHCGILMVPMAPFGRLTRQQAQSHYGLHLALVLAEIALDMMMAHVVENLE